MRDSTRWLFGLVAVAFLGWVFRSFFLGGTPREAPATAPSSKDDAPTPPPLGPSGTGPVNPFTKEPLPTPPPPEETPSAEHRLRVPISGLQAPTSDGGKLAISGPLLEVAVRVTHEPDPEVGVLHVQSRVSDSKGKVWVSESDLWVWRLARPLTVQPTEKYEDDDDDGDEEGDEEPEHKNRAKHVVHANADPRARTQVLFFDRAPSAWQKAFDTKGLVRRVSCLEDGRDTVTLRIGGAEHHIYYKYQGVHIDVALLNPETIVVRANDLLETLDFETRKTKELEPIAYTLPAAELLWFAGRWLHYAGREDHWNEPEERAPLVFRGTEEHAPPSPSVVYTR